MRTWLAVALTLTAFAAGCGPPRAEPVFGPPPQAELLQPLISDSDVVDGIRINQNAWIKTYPVSAEGGLASIRRQLDRIGPTSNDTDQRFDALTTWALRWSFSYDETQTGCSLRNATIQVEAVISLPDLQDAGQLPPEEFNLWQGYHEKLRAHEDGHVDIYFTAARDLRNQILETPPMEDCRSLATVLNQKGDAMLDAIKNNDRLFDAATGHGAAFP